MNYQRMKKDEFLRQCELRIQNSINDEAIASRVAQMGYPLQKLQEGSALLAEANALTERQNKEYGDVDAAFAIRDTEREKAKDTYTKFRTLAKLTFRNDTANLVTLKLNRKTAVTKSGWLKETRNFYNALLANEASITAMGQFGVTKKDLEEAREQIEKVAGLAEKILREKGDAQDATEKRDDKYEELHVWVSDYETVAEIALSESPQLLEKLGIVVK